MNELTYNILDPNIKLATHQVEPTNELISCLSDVNNSTGRIVIGPTGCGKTWVMAAAIRQVQHSIPSYYLYGGNTNDDEMFRLHPIMLITPRNCITEQQRVLTRCSIKDVAVCSIDSLGSSYGENYIDWVSRMEKGNLVHTPVWRAESMPRCILLDECQNAKNPRSRRAKILQAYVNQGGKLIAVSATPFQKGCETKLLMTACGITDESGFQFWVDYTTNYQSNDNSPTAVARIKKVLEDNGVLISIKNVRYPFKPITKNWLIEPTPEQSKAIAASYAKYCEARAKANKRQHQYIIAVWQAQRVMRLECELERVPNICIHAREHELQNGKAVIIASNYIPTLKGCWKYLVRTLGVAPDKISFLVGNQTDKEKQKNIDDFQQGKTHYFLTTLKSGGTGLNLNHNCEASRPRVIILPPTWSVYELIQVLGRAQRITNLSQVVQIIAWFKGTVEEDVAARLEKKYNCIKELLNNKDSYITDIFNKALGDGDDLMAEIKADELEESLEFVDNDDGSVTVKGNKAVTKKEDEPVEEESFFDLGMLCEDEVVK